MIALLTTEIKYTISCNFESRYSDPNLATLLDVCTFLDPRFKETNPDESLITSVKEEMLFSVQDSPITPLKHDDSLLPPPPKKKAG